uniref:RNase H type-1 domain-containing protein n=1 Tax=Opuntia streptacantha TaxID=393608 RepID=A0A7C9CUA9_OPUST
MPMAEEASFLSYATRVADLCGWEKLTVFLAMAWACWVSRNKRIMANEDPNMELLVTGFLKLLTDYQVYSRKISFSPHQSATHSFDSWFPPPSGYIKLNSDAAVIKGFGAGLGWVARDASGNVVEIGCKKQAGVFLADLAEAMAARFALIHAHTRGWKKVVIESDSLSLITKLQTGRRGQAYIDVVIADIRKIVLSFESLLSSHVRKKGNSVAHLVARLHPLNGREQYFCTDFPPSILSLVEFDRL